jgi:hypothetical protein
MSDRRKNVRAQDATQIEGGGTLPLQRKRGHKDANVSERRTGKMSAAASTDDKLAQIKVLLKDLGKKIEQERTPLKITSIVDIDRHVPAQPGVYWIETTMPVDALRMAISKEPRKEPPSGAKLTHQTGKGLYVIYSGTEDNLNKRLKQHLFNKGSQGTKRLGCVIDQRPFSNYRWQISFRVIDSYELRYAVEAWWRLNVGWPLFCKR